jgi:hypothetical protein
MIGRPEVDIRDFSAAHLLIKRLGGTVQLIRSCADPIITDLHNWTGTAGVFDLGSNYGVNL